MRGVFDRTVKPAYVALRGAVNRVQDRRLGIQTLTPVELRELGLEGPDRNCYKPSEWMTLRRILPKSEVSSDDVFIDVGSGMGRVIFEAARYPLKRVIGVELSPELNAIARGNIERNLQRLACRDVQLITIDALDYQFPDDVTIAYFANPFKGRTFARVFENLLASLDRSPRRLRLVYRNPVEHEYLLSTGRVRPTKRLRGFRPGREWSASNSTRLYEVLPSRGDGGDGQ